MPEVVAERAHEVEQRGEFGDGNEERAGDVADAVGERHEERDSDKQQIDDDEVQVNIHAVEGENDGIDRREDRDENRHQIDDRHLPARGPRIALGAELGEPGKRSEPGEERRVAAGSSRCSVAHGSARLSSARMRIRISPSLFWPLPSRPTPQ